VQFRFADEIRVDANAVIARLKAQGMRVAIVSGDRTATVADLAAGLGVDEWHAGIDPAGKAALLSDLARQGRKVLMIGDGMNDAPALAAAYVSASPSSALDVAQSAADIVFQGDRLGPVIDILEMGHRAARIMRQNMAAALLYNLGAVPLAIAGHVTPLIAAVSMSSSSIVVIANALRLNFAAGKRGVGVWKS
jgi:Cu2+-exporting ATPase